MHVSVDTTEKESRPMKRIIRDADMKLQNLDSELWPSDEAIVHFPRTRNNTRRRCLEHTSVVLLIFSCEYFADLQSYS